MYKKIFLLVIICSIASVSTISAQSTTDILTILRSYLQPPNATVDKNNDSVVNLVDAALAINLLTRPTNTQPPQPTVNPVPNPQAGTTWYQDYGNPQRTSYVTTNPLSPFTYAWSWNGGPLSQHKYNAPREARIIVANGKMYAPAGNQGLYAVNLSSGAQVWNTRPGGNINASPAYDPKTNTVITGSSNGNVYKLDPSTGSLLATYATGSSVEDAVLIVGDHAYVVDQSGTLHKINISNMTSTWKYAGGSRGMTPAAYSATKNALFYATLDLHVHAVDNNRGTMLWKVKPHPGNPSPSDNNTYQYSVPVIADAYGIVLIYQQLNYYAMTNCGPGGNGIFMGSPSEIQSSLANNPSCQFLFALDTTTGQKKFIPAVGYSSVEDKFIGRAAAGDTTINYAGDFAAMLNTNPVVKTNSDGSQIAYVVVRSGQNTSSDFRWTGAMGQMSLTGSDAGIFKFVRMAKANDNGSYGGLSYLNIVDESATLTVAHNLIFASHWSAAIGSRLTGSGIGDTFKTPLMTEDIVVLGRAAKDSCGAANHLATGGYSYVTDGGRFTPYRPLPGGFFYNYCGEPDAPGWNAQANNQAGTTYSTGAQGRFTMVAEGYIFFQGNGGDVVAVRHQ